MARVFVVVAFVFILATAGRASAVDVDGDTFDPPADCNDNDDTVHPGAMEIVGD